jgi:hypothetical protein
LELFRRSIADDARRWFDLKTFKSIESLKEQFLRRYGSSCSLEDNLNIFSNLKFKEGEDLEAYATTLIEAAQAIGLKDEQKVKLQFFRGLPQVLQSSAVLVHDKPLDEIVSCLSKFAELNSTSKRVTFKSDSVHNAEKGAQSLTPRSKYMVESIHNEVTNVRGLLDDMRAQHISQPVVTGNRRVTYRDPTPPRPRGEPTYPIGDESFFLNREPNPEQRRQFRPIHRRPRSASPHYRHDRQERHRSPSPARPRFPNNPFSHTGHNPPSFGSGDRSRDQIRDESINRRRPDSSFTRDSFSRPQRRDTRFCNHCQKPGHVWQQCRQLVRKYGRQEDF